MRIRAKIIIFLALLLLTRFYNLNYTARFTEDESKDLVGMHQVYVDKKLTLVGPTNDQGTKVFSSLTFYMLLPGAIILNFSPSSPAYSAAVWGIITAVLLVILAHKVNKKLSYLVAALTIFWFPLLLTSRWAWNPNFIPFWIVLSLLLLTYKSKWAKLAAGLALGLSIHAHYYSVFAVGIFLLLVSAFYLQKKQIRDMFHLWIGFAIPLVPFIIFDMRHPPGIFLPSLLSQSGTVGGSFDLGLVISKSVGNLHEALLSYSQSGVLYVVLLVLTALLFIFDVRKRNGNLLYLAPWIFQIVLISFIPQFFPHYLLPGLIFFVVWLVSKREGVGHKLAYMTLLLLLVGGIFSVRKQLTEATFTPPTTVVEEIAKDMERAIVSGDLKNVNIAVLGSPDQNTEGKKYRDLFLVNTGRSILTKNEYQFADHLFVVSTSTENTVRQDPSYEISRFRKGPLVESWKIDNSEWFLYHFTRN